MQPNPTTESPDHRRRAPAATLDPRRFAGRTVLAVWAHPDDESYLGGGLMATVAATGGRVVNLTATLGEHGTPDPVASPPATMAEIRRGELAGALSALGVDESFVLGYEDGTLESIHPELGARAVMTVLTDVDPDVVVTFGPDGVTGHPDHIAVGSWADHAVAASGSRAAVLHTAAGRVIPSDVVAAMDELGAFFPGHPRAGDPGADFGLPLDQATLDTKMAALFAHASQVDIVRDHLGAEGYRRLAAVEAYAPANEAAWELLTGSVPVSAA